MCTLVFLLPFSGFFSLDKWEFTTFSLKFRTSSDQFLESLCRHLSDRQLEKIRFTDKKCNFLQSESINIQVTRYWQSMLLISKWQTLQISNWIANGRLVPSRLQLNILTSILFFKSSPHIWTEIKFRFLTLCMDEKCFPCVSLCIMKYFTFRNN